MQKYKRRYPIKCQDPVVQSIVSLTSSLVVKMLTVPVSNIFYSQVILLKKMWVAFANAKATLIFFFSKNISISAIFNDQSFIDTLTNDIISFEQLGPETRRTAFSRHQLKDRRGTNSAKQTSYMKLLMYSQSNKCHRGTALEQSVEKNTSGWVWLGLVR